MKQRKIVVDSDLNLFCSRYLDEAGLEIPIQYLKRHKVFGFYRKGVLIGGYIIAAGSTRTIQTFSSAKQQGSLRNVIGEDQGCHEICCFWATKEFRRHRLGMALAWLTLAFTCHLHAEKLVLYGTNSLGLARVYAYPKNSILLHQDSILGQNTWIFIARRRDFFLGVFGLVLTRLLSGRSTDRLRTRMQNKLFIYEV